MALFTQYAVAAAEEAMGQSGLQEHLRRADRWERARVVSLPVQHFATIAQDFLPL